MQKDEINFGLILKNFETPLRFESFIKRIEQVEIKKTVFGVLTNYTNHNWDLLYKDCQYVRDLADFLICSHCSRVAENLKTQCRLTYINPSLVDQGVHEMLSHLEHISQVIKLTYGKCKILDEGNEEYELFSYNAIKYRDVEIIKTTAPSIK